MAFELETAALEHELVNELFYDGRIRTWRKSASITIELSGDYKLVISPMVRSYGGYPIWGQMLRTAETEITQRLQVHVALRKGEQSENLTEFEVKANSLERVVLKALVQIQQICNKRLVVQLVEDIDPN